VHAGCSTCQSKSNFNNIKNNGKGYSAEACGPTNFGKYAREHGTDGMFTSVCVKVISLSFERGRVVWRM
jgi:hypothetical protein